MMKINVIIVNSRIVFRKNGYQTKIRAQAEQEKGTKYQIIKCGSRCRGYNHTYIMAKF